MAVLSEKLRKFRGQTGQIEEPLPKQEAGAVESDLADYVMPFAGMSRRVLSKVAEKGAKEIAEKAATETAKQGAKQSVTAIIAKESAEELSDAAKRNAAKGFLGKIETESRKYEPKPMPGEAPFKGELPGPAGQKVGANKPSIKEGPAIDYSKNKVSTNEEIGAPVFTYSGRSKSPKYTPRKK
jgi:hypothetical protein